MTVHVDFWREVRGPRGAMDRTTVMSLVESDALSNAEALEKATARFCAAAKIHDWRTLADGYEIRRDS